MAHRTTLITNNPAYASTSREGLDVRLLDGTAFDVLVAARDAVHGGWRILNHPLYGNFRPGHQPFRSMLLAAPVSEGTIPHPVDLESLEYLEQALGVYRACEGRTATPSGVSEALFRDCSRIDQELMSATMNLYTSV